MSLIAAALLAQFYVNVPEPVHPPTNPSDAFALFRRLCVETFPDPAQMEARIASEPGMVRWQPSTEMERLIPARVWHSRTATVRVTAGGSMPRDLPDPQCSVRVTAPEGTQIEQLFPALASALGLGKGRVVGKRAFRTGMWDLVAPGRRWRIILGTRRQDGRLNLNLSMLNLRSK